MPHSYCACCDAIIASNQKKFKVTYPSIKGLLLEWSTDAGKELLDWMVVCQKCYLKCVAAIKSRKIPEFKSRRKILPSAESVQMQESVSQDNWMDWSASEQASTGESSSMHTATSSHQTETNTGMLVQATMKTQSQCIICKNKTPAGRAKIPSSAIMDIWLQYNIYIPRENRCCSGHLNSRGKFSEESIATIQSQTKQITLSTQEVAQLIQALTREAQTEDQSDKRLSFDTCSSLSDKQYKMLTGLERWQFDNLFTYCEGQLRISSNRSPRDALAILLMKLRLDVSQEVLAFLFEIDSQSRISETITSVMKILQDNFVNKYLGYNHLPRETLIQEHTPSFVKHILHASEESAIAIMDGTYLYIEKSSNMELQKKTFSMHKSRNLVKPMMVVAADGYIIDAEGPYFADGDNNDASILKSMMRKSGFRHYFLEDDEFVLDRGFRDAIVEAEASGFKTSMPHLLGKKEKQFSAIQANDSRRVTMIRWVVESVNGGLKHVFKFFKNTIPITYLPKIGPLFKIACAISNAYFVPLLTEREDHKWLVEEVQRRAPLLNTLQVEVEPLLRKTACWQLVTEDVLPTFPYLTEEDLKKITLGSYQLKMAPAYCSHHMGSATGYQAYIHKENESLFRAKIKSRFVKIKKHELWIELDQNKLGYEAISRWYCTCQVGARLVGTCSHVTSVLWYLGHGRFLPNLKLPSQALAENILTARLMECDTDGEDYQRDPDEDELDLENI